MQYDEPPSTSAEYLRMTLPMISEHALGANPVNYAVMYEYVSGINPPLKSAIDAELGKGGKLSSETARELFENHVLPADSVRLERVQGEILAMVESLETSVIEAGDRANRFGDSLEQCDRDARAEPANVTSVLRELLKRTREMHSSNEKLQASLELHAEEASTLRDQLESARRQAVRDALTGLLNRSGFDAAVQEILAEAPEFDHGICLMMVDIDHFKKVNDTYGHLFGDKVIKVVAELLRKSIKGKDAAARFGGEEFVVMLPDTPLPGAFVVAENIRRALERARIRRAGSGETIGNITLSVGVATLQPDESVAALIERADAALYASKENGRNRVTCDQAA